MDITDTLIRAMVGRVEITSPGTDVKLVVTVFALLVIFLKVPQGQPQINAVTLVLLVYSTYLAYCLTCKYPILGTGVMLSLLGVTVYWRTLWHREQMLQQHSQSTVEKESNSKEAEEKSIHRKNIDGKKGPGLLTNGTTTRGPKASRSRLIAREKRKLLAELAALEDESDDDEDEDHDDSTTLNGVESDDSAPMSFIEGRRSKSSTPVTRGMVAAKKRSAKTLTTK